MCSHNEACTYTHTQTSTHMHKTFFCVFRQQLPLLLQQHCAYVTLHACLLHFTHTHTLVFLCLLLITYFTSLSNFVFVRCFFFQLLLHRFSFPFAYVRFCCFFFRFAAFCLLLSLCCCCYSCCKAKKINDKFSNAASAAAAAATAAAATIAKRATLTHTQTRKQ